jgi:hypothetical protein
MSQSAPIINHTQIRIEQISHPSHPLCREDVIWMLELIKKKVVEQDPSIMDLDQPQLIQHFNAFAELAMKLNHRRTASYPEDEHLTAWIYQANFSS